MFDVTSNSQNDLVLYLWHRYLSLGLILPFPSPILAWILRALFVRNVFRNKDGTLYKVFIQLSIHVQTVEPFGWILLLMLAALLFAI